MKKFAKLTTLTLGLMATLTLSAAPINNNPVPAGGVKSALQNPNVQSKIANNQDVMNSLIQWLNANFVTGTPLQFAQAMKGNLQNFLANHSLVDLNWVVTQKITYALLSGADVDNPAVPTTLESSDAIKSRVPLFNIGSLLTQNSINVKSKEYVNAQILLSFVSGLNDPVSGLPKGVVSRGLGPVSDFQQQFGTYVAQQSVGLNVLYGLLNERVVKAGLGSQLGGPKKDMSPLELDEYMATRRLNVNDPKGWLGQLANATPAQMSKEQLMIMAEMRYEQYMTRRAIEQMNMLMAVQQLQMTGQNAVALKKLRDQVLTASTSTVLGN